MKLKKKILVTGGAGFIGSSLSNELFDDGYEVHVCDNLLTGNLTNLYKKIIFHNLNVNNYSKLSSVMNKYK